MSDPSQTYIDRIEARAFSRATEVPERVRTALLTLFPEDIQEHVILTEETTEGHHKNPIRILNATLEHPFTDETSRFIFSHLTQSDMDSLLKTFERRIDEDCTFFLRIDKQAAYLGYIEMAMAPDVISLQIYIRKLPRCRPTDAKALIEHYASFAGASPS
ncbi:MAG: RNA-binding domain-containing protein [Candidatus Thorarchaeota archaeon]